MYLMKCKLIFLFFGLGIALAVTGYGEWKQSANVQAEPEQIACAVFEARGPRDNNHIELSGFNVTKDMYFAYEESAIGYSQCLVPVFPLNRNTQPKNHEFRVILEFRNVKGDGDLLRLVQQRSVTGITGTCGSSLNHEFRDILEGGYPGINLDKCNVIRVGRSVPTAAGGLTKMGGGSCLVFGMLGLGIWNFKKGRSRMKWGGNAKVDTSGTDFMANRISTTTNPQKFREAEARREQLRPEPEPAELKPEESDTDQSVCEEELAYRRQFAQRYGIQGETMDAPDSDDPTSSSSQSTLSY